MTPALSWAKRVIHKIRRVRLPLVGPVLVFAAGIWLADFLPFSPWAGRLVLLAFAVGILTLRWPTNSALRLAIFLTGVALHSLQLAALPIPPAEPQLTHLTGQVVEPPAPFGATGERFRVICQTAEGHRMVLWRGLPGPAYGDRIDVRGVLRAVPPPRNPGEFNYADWLKRRGITTELEAANPGDCTLESRGHGNPLIRFALAARAWISRVITSSLDPADSATALIQAMTLGETSGVPDAVREDFQLSGTLHVFSVSGLHVAMVALIVWQIVRLLRLPRWAQAGLVLGVIFFYALITGWSPPSVRAAIMMACFIVAALAGRQAQPFNILAGAAGVLLLMNPAELFNVGFQLSFVVVAAIFVFAKMWQSGLQSVLAPDPWLPRPLYSRWREGQWQLAYHFGSLLAVSLAAALGSLLLTGFHFHFISLVAPWINLLVVPLSFLILCLAMLSILAGGFSTWLAGTFAQSNWLASALTLFLVQQSANLPVSYLYVGTPLNPAVRTEVTVFDAGRGAAVVIQTANQTVLVDTGTEFFFQRTVLPELRRRGINRVQGMILSHGDAQHLGGTPRAIPELRPDWIGVPSVRSRSPVLAEIRKQPPPNLRELSAGERIPLGEKIWLEVLGPERVEGFPLADDAGLILRLRVAEWSTLFTFDAGFRTEDELRRAAPNSLPADVWIKGQHRNGLSGGDAFLATVSPFVVIASHADFPETERLAPVWIRAVQSTGARVFNQAETGAVRIEFRADQIRLIPFLDGEPMEIHRCSADGQADIKRDGRDDPSGRDGNSPPH